VKRLSVAFVLAFGDADGGFFPDSLLAQLCERARERGHRGAMVRVHHDPSDGDGEVSKRLSRWLSERGADLVVVDRVVSPEPLRDHVAAAPGRHALYVFRGESFDPSEGVDLALGALPGSTRAGTTRRTPSIPTLVRAFEALLDALSEGRDPLTVAGLTRFADGGVTAGPPLPRDPPPVEPFRASTDWEVIALGPVAPVTRKALFGNAGCPFADDPAENPHYARVHLPVDAPIARLGCAFCDLGGDYEKRPDAEVIASLVEQARFWCDRDADVRELVLTDQHPLRYLAALLRAAHAGGVRPSRWLFAARVDTFVKERARVLDAIAAAEETGHAIELYLSGFEAFCDAELGRYNKGVTVREQLAAVAAMRDLARAHPKRFSYARSRGHSLILWNPWTTPDDLAETLSNVRAHGLGELFHELGRNRLRLYRDLPITYAAARDGALTDAWEAGDHGVAQRKGYSPEAPWRFLDGRTRDGYALATALREALGREHEVAQLTALTRHVRSNGSPSLPGLTDLSDALDALCRERTADAPKQGASVRARVVRFAGGCNNRCAACANGDRWLDDAPDALLARVDEARLAPGAIALAGREPTIHSAFLEAVSRAHGRDRRLVAVVTNGRRFVYPRFVDACVRAGLGAASVKLFATTPSASDAITGSPGAHAQALDGASRLVAARRVAVEIRAPLHRENLSEYSGFAELAARLGVRQLRVECALDAVELARLSEAADAVRALSARCAALGVALDAAPLSAATTAFDRVPALTPERG
jgi:pyruvate-formate lyase-activating enzyme